MLGFKRFFNARRVVAGVELVWDPPWNQHMISEAGKMKLGLI